MPRRHLTALAAAVALLGGAPAAVASDTLLSGYGGPGDGSQQLLGDQLLGGYDGGGSGAGGGSLRVPDGDAPLSGYGSDPVSGYGSQDPPSSSAVAGTTSGRGGGAPSGSPSSSRPAAPRERAGSDVAGATSTVSPAAALTPYPQVEADSAGLPLDAIDLLLLGGAALVVALAAAALHGLLRPRPLPGA